MRILHIISGLGTGGAEAMLMRLVHGGGRHEHVVASLSGLGDHGPHLQAAGIEVASIELRRMSGILGVAPWVRNLIRRFGADLIQGWMPHGNLVATLGASVGGHRVPLAWNVRQSLADLSHDRPLTRRLIHFNARLSHRPRAIIYNSMVGALDHEGIGYASERRHLIPNGFDLGRFSPSPAGREVVRRELGITEGEQAIGLVGRFHSIKNHAAFFEAASIVLVKAPAVRFVLAGSGISEENPQLMALVRDPEVRRRSLFLGNRADADRINCAFDLACNVSHLESFPNAVGEAMASAVPCLVTDVGDSAAIIGDGGLVCADTSASAIAAAMLRFIGMSGVEREAMGQRARRRAESHFALPQIVRKYDDLYDDLVARGEPSQ